MSSDAPLVCKFGGSSVADAERVRAVAAIVAADPRRRYVVVSAPGKRDASDRKITDLLYLCSHTLAAGMNADGILSVIRERYESIGADLGVSGVGSWLDEVVEGMKAGRPMDWVASRGEWLQAKIVAAHMGARFVDATECIVFGLDGRPSRASYSRTAAAVQGEGTCVIPGFYGLDANGEVRTFSRGGSDITGAIVARAVGAEAYENWTDVDGLLMADPKVVPDPRPIREVTYQELRELAYMGATVLHDEAVFPVREAGIPIHIRNTAAPELPGTWIRTTRPATELPIVGVAGRPGFVTVQVEKDLMNKEVGFGRRVLGIFESHGVPFEHAPSSIDSMSVIVSEEQLHEHEQPVLVEIARTLEPDRVEALHGLALIATVGQGMSHRIGIAGRLFAALAEAGVNIRMINQGASEISIIVGVAADDFQKAVRAIYDAFVPAE